MIKKLGHINISYDKIKKFLGTYGYNEHSTFASAEWIEEQTIILKKIGFPETEIDNWRKYKPDATMMSYSLFSDVFDKYIIKLLGDDFFQNNGCEKEVLGCNVQCQMPGNFTVPHVDVYHSVTKKTDATREGVMRLWIPLEDAKFGHVLFVGDTVLTDFKTGEIYDWDLEDMHAAANAGLAPRYTLLVYLRRRLD